MPFPGEEVPASALTFTGRQGGGYDVHYRGIRLGWVRRYHAVDQLTGQVTAYWRGFAVDATRPRWWAYKRLDLGRIMVAESPTSPEHRGGTPA